MMERNAEATKTMTPHTGRFGTGETEMRGVFSQMKASELPFEAANEFSDAPFEFEETAALLWNDTRVIYYHAGIENRFSENYLRLCRPLEKNIRRLGTFCLTKAAMEQKGFEFPDLKDLDILELLKMVSFHLRKCHAAFQGCYEGNDLIGMAYINWEFRWFDLGNRLKATGVKIDKIKSGEIRADSLFEQTEKFKGEPRTNDRPENINTGSLHLNPSALPMESSFARNMLRMEKEQARAKAKEQQKQEKEHIKNIRRPAPPFDLARPFGDPPAFAPLKEFLTGEKNPSPSPGRIAADRENKAEIVIPQPEKKPAPGYITAEEACATLIKDALARNDREALEAIPGEDIHTLHERWERYCERIERAAAVQAHSARAGPDPEVRKKLRERRKKRS